MDKDILMDYIDSCRLIEETERDIIKIRELYVDSDAGEKLEKEETALFLRIEKAERIKRSVEEWMLTIPARMQRIIRLHYFERLTWDQTARRMGPYESGDALKQEFRRFIK